MTSTTTPLRLAAIALAGSAFSIGAHAQQQGSGYAAAEGWYEEAICTSRPVFASEKSTSRRRATRDVQNAWEAEAKERILDGLARSGGETFHVVRGDYEIEVWLSSVDVVVIDYVEPVNAKTYCNFERTGRLQSWECHIQAGACMTTARVIPGSDLEFEQGRVRDVIGE